MKDLAKCILISNNKKACDYFREQLDVVERTAYLDVLIEARNRIQNGDLLLTHPMASSLKPNQTPYRSILLYPASECAEDEDRYEGERLMENAIEAFRKFEEIHTIPEYSPEVSSDYMTIDLSVIQNAVKHIG